jgi:hypothetical protein
MTLRTPAFALLPLLLSMLCALPALDGCCHSKESAATSEDVVRPFAVELSSGGGFSNMHAGHIIHDDGSVLFWQGINASHESMRTIGAVKPERIRTLKKTVNEAKLSSLSYHETGNMTTTLRVTDGDAVMVLTWPGAETDAETVPAELQELCRRIHDIVTAAENYQAK